MATKLLKDWSVPEQRDCIFTRPDFKKWPTLLRRNIASFSNIDSRCTSRAELINLATEYTHMIGCLELKYKNVANIIVTGHQPNWHHCGIIAKSVITDRFARQVHGIAVELVLDNDICDSTMLLPEHHDNNFADCKTNPMEGRHLNIPLELRHVPSKMQLVRFINEVLTNDTDSLCSEIWYSNRNSIINNAQLCRNVADLITQMIFLLYQALGLEIIYLPVSIMSQSNSFIDFVLSIICEPLSFASIYNLAISDKIKAENLRPDQTIRMLKTDYLNNIIELPFWIISQSGKRSSLYVKFSNNTLQIGATDKVIDTINFSGDSKLQLLEILRKNKYVIRPKAVTLTLFTRLYLADLFVHGTGAGNYEYITDQLIQNYYKISDTDFGIATATMTLLNDFNSRDLKTVHEKLNYREFFFGLFPRFRLERFIDINEDENENSTDYSTPS